MLKVREVGPCVRPYFGKAGFRADIPKVSVVIRCRRVGVSVVSAPRVLHRFVANFTGLQAKFATVGLGLDSVVQIRTEIARPNAEFCASRSGEVSFSGIACTLPCCRMGSGMMAGASLCYAVFHDHIEALG